MTKQVVRYLAALFVALLLSATLVLPFPLASGQSAPDAEQLSLPSNLEEPLTKAYPNLDSALAQLVVDGNAKGPIHARALAEEMGFAIQDESSVRVIIESEAATTSETIAAAEALGAVVETTYQHLVQARVPLASLEALSRTSGVKFVERPLSPIPEAVMSEGVNVIGANTWQAAGFRGAGVKIAVVDGGFSGYASLLGTELPSNVITHWAPSLGGPGSSPHGTACAEIIYDVAPEATLYLVNVSTTVELGNAVDWLIAEGVNVISHSASWFAGPGDGTGVVDSIVDNARGNGILWVNAAGNYGQAHWSGAWSDSDSDNWLNVSGDVEGNAFYADSGDIVFAVLRWNDPWGAATNDYNLYLYKNGNPPTQVTQSTNVQSGSQNPVEGLLYLASTSGEYFLSIRRYAAAGTSTVFDLFVPDYVLQYEVAAGSIAIPADSSNALAVGAVAWNAASTIETYSSRGPTRDGRIKPDLVAPTRVSTASYGAGSFAGTSSAAPHVAGAAALVKQKYPGYTPAQIQSLLEGRAVGLGASGKDNVFGSGRLQLGSAYEVPVADFRANATTVQAGTAITFTDDSTNSPTSWAWDFDNNGSTDSTAQNPSNTYTAAGSYTVKLTATNPGGSNTTTKSNYITVTAGPLHHLTVSPSSPSVQAGAGQTFTAQGYDQYNNLRTGDVFTWSVTNPTAGSINASTGVFTAGTVAGAYSNVIRAASGVVNGTASVTVTAGPLHHIAVSPPNLSLGPGGNQTFTAQGYDQYNNPRTGDVFAWSVTNPTAGSINPSTGVFTAGTVAGSYDGVIRAYSGSIFGAASVTITAGALHHISVSPGNPSVAVGGDQTYTAVGYDQYNNPRTGDVFAWSVTNPLAGSIDATTAVFTAGTVPGSYSSVIRADSGAGTGTASVTIAAGPQHHIVVSPANPSVPVDSSQGFTATGYDQYDNPRTGDVFTWSMDSPVAGSINASTGVFTAGTVAGTYADVIRATSGEITGTASVTVTPGALHHIVVVPSTTSVPAGNTQSFAASGYDQYNSLRSGDNFTWSVSNAAAGSINASTGVFTAGGTPGVYTDVVNVGSGAVSATASVTVIVGPLHHVTVSPSSPSVAVNGGQTFTAAGFDQFENPVTGLTFSWSVNNSSAGSIEASTGVFTAGTLARTFNNVVQARSGAITGAASVTVMPGQLHHVGVVPGNPYVPVNRSQAYSATGYDQYSNAISGLTFSWSLTDTSAGSIGASMGIFIAGNSPGTYSDVIRVASGPFSGMASVSVIDGNVLNGTATLQGNSRTPAGKAVDVTVKLFNPGAPDIVNDAPLATFNATTQDVGGPVLFQVTGGALAPGDYDITVATHHTLTNVKRNVAIVPGINSADFGALLEGNSNNDGIINAIDFSILSATYLRSTGQAGFDARADYDYNGIVNAVDFSLMASNYLKASPRTVNTATVQTRIAFASDRDGNLEIYAADPDGSNQTRLTDNGGADAWPTWSPDGKKIAFHSNRDGNWRLYVMNANGSGVVPLTGNSTVDAAPVWSPDGEKIAFASHRDGNWEIYVMKADGSSQTRLTNSSTLDDCPSWSPDGKKIAFHSVRDGNYEIYVMNADGSGQTRLTNDASDDLEPSWSPDSSKIAFSSKRDGDSEIYVMNADGSGQARITNNSVNDWDPVWSPDGNKVVFVSDRDGNNELYIMNIDGSGQTRLTTNSAVEGWVAWSPR